MKIQISLALSAAVFLSACAGMPSPPPAGSLKVATWNIEHLAEKDGEGCRPRTEAHYVLLRRHADALNADVIAFQEVQSEAAARRIFDPAKYDIALSSRPSSGTGGGCRGKPGLNIQNQSVGFAVRKGVAWRRNEDLSALALGNLWSPYRSDRLSARSRPSRRRLRQRRGDRGSSWRETVHPSHRPCHRRSCEAS